MSTRDEILAAARTRFGMPYRLDPPPDGVHNIDCSLYVLKTLEDAGLPIRGVRTAEQIRQATVPIGWDEVKPGDLLFFEHTYDAAGPAGPDGRIASHIGISLGAGTRRMYDANDARGTGETVLSDWWQGHLFEARRHPSLMGQVDEAGPSVEPARGIDVASHQGTVDWRAVAGSGQAFAFTKASGGTWYTNPTFRRNWSEIKAAGLVRGAYHYAFESSGAPLPGDGPEAEAEYFVATILHAGGIETGDMLALDLEDGRGQLGEWTLRFCRRVEQLVGFPPLVYTGAWFSVPHGLGAVPELARYPLWLAAYQDTQPSPPPPWSEVAIWQHSASGRVPGVVGDCDLNVFNGDASRLAFFGKPGAVVTVPAGHPDFAQPGQVGSGILEMMAADQTQPAAPSSFLPLGASPAVIEEAVGMNGVTYRWHIPTGQRWRYHPAA